MDRVVLVDHHRVPRLDTDPDHGRVLWFHFQEDQAECKEESVPLRFNILFGFIPLCICCKFQRAHEQRGLEAK